MRTVRVINREFDVSWILADLTEDIKKDTPPEFTIEVLDYVKVECLMRWADLHLKVTYKWQGNGTILRVLERVVIEL